MALQKLFKTPNEILLGYEELNKKGGRKVYLRGRVLNTGKVSLYLYANEDGKVFRQTLGSSLVPELTQDLKNQNKEVLRLAMIQADTINANMEREVAGLPQKRKSRIPLAEYIGALAERAKADGRKGRWYELRSLKKHVENCDPKILVSNADAKFVRAFIHYTETEAKDTHYKGNKGDGKKLAENTRWTFCRNLKSVFKQAIREHLLSSNPFLELERKELPHIQLDRREYLTVEDVRQLMATPCKSEAIRNCFLFCCFVGLRYGDAKALRWKDVGRDDNGLFVSIIQQKTKEPLRAYISKVAEQFMPPMEENAADGGKVFHLPNNTYCNKIVKQWAKDAKVKKNITFHVSRHTAATMLLNLDAALEVVAKQLGHKRTSTTEIYAKIIGRTQSVAVNKQDSLFADSIEKETEKE